MSILCAGRGIYFLFFNPQHTSLKGSVQEKSHQKSDLGGRIVGSVQGWHEFIRIIERAWLPDLPADLLFDYCSSQRSLGVVIDSSAALSVAWSILPVYHRFMQRINDLGFFDRCRHAL